jgi:flagellar motor switch protein FliN
MADLTEQEIEQQMLKQMQQSQTPPPATVGSVSVESAQFQPLDPTPSASEREKKMELLLDLALPVSIELGRTDLMISEILNLKRGSVVEFEKLASEPVDILINGKKMAEGEVVVIEKHFGIRITNLSETTDRIKSLGK